MEDLIQNKRTRFRAYQLGSAGSMFSYWDGDKFTLIDARVGDISRPNLTSELKMCGKSQIDCLHITSWDTDHCTESALDEILTKWTPTEIQYPGYDPKTSTGIACLREIKAYKAERAKKITKVDPPYIDDLKPASNWGYKDIMYWPKRIDQDNANNNSSVKFLRTGCFNVLSLGDVESAEISNYLKGCKTLRSETDVLILAHHGANNGFTTRAFLKNLSPSVAVCSANHGNQFQHPKPEIGQLLTSLDIPVKTTKRGDVLILSEGSHRRNYQVINSQARSTEIAGEVERYKSKKSSFLDNPDRARAHYNKPKNPFAKFR